MQMAAAGAVSESANSTSAITGMDSKGSLSDEKQGVERQGCEGEHPPHLDGGVEAGDESSVESMRQEIDKLKMEMSKLRSENEGLKQLRKQMDNEIEELTAALFQEAYKMVNGAHARRAGVEKQLQETRGKMSALEVEGQALKALLEAEGKLPSFSASAARGGLKIASQTRGMGMLETGPSRTCQLPTGSRGVGPVDGAVSDDVASCPQWCYSEENWTEFKALQLWLLKKSLSRDDSFMELLLSVDILPCLTFENKELSQRVLSAIEDNCLYMERVPSQVDSTSSKCSLTFTTSPCCYRLKLAEHEPWYYVSEASRNRVASVCDLYMFLRHCQLGLIKMDDQSVYWEINCLRANIALARLHFSAKLH